MNLPESKGHGLYRKFHVTRLDGSSLASASGACAAFVLDLTHDPYASGVAAVMSVGERMDARGYVVSRTDGTSAPGGKHDGCEYLVLDLTALDADRRKLYAGLLMTYAVLCVREYPTLSADLFALARSL